MKAYSELTQADVDALQAKHGKLYCTEFEIDGETIGFIYKSPKMVTIEAVTAKTQAEDLTGANKLLLNDCIVAGDKQYIDGESNAFNVRIYNSVAESLGKLLAPVKPKSSNKFGLSTVSGGQSKELQE